MEIWNDATGSAEKGNYKFKISKWGNPKSIWKAGNVRNFSRLQRGPWDLLWLVLCEAVSDRNQNTGEYQ